MPSTTLAVDQYMQSGSSTHRMYGLFAPDRDDEHGHGTRWTQRALMYLSERRTALPEETDGVWGQPVEPEVAKEVARRRGRSLAEIVVAEQLATFRERQAEAAIARRARAACVAGIKQQRAEKANLEWEEARQVVALLAVASMSGYAVAKLLDMPVVTVRERLFWALQRSFIRFDMESGECCATDHGREWVWEEDVLLK